MCNEFEPQLGKRFNSNESIPPDMTVITFYDNGTTQIWNGRCRASTTPKGITYELLNYKFPKKPLTPEIGGWYLVEEKHRLALDNERKRYILKYIGDKARMLDLCFNPQLNSSLYNFIEEWGPVEK